MKFGGKQRNWLTKQVSLNYILCNECSVPSRKKRKNYQRQLVKRVNVFKISMVCQWQFFCFSKPGAVFGCKKAKFT